MSRVAQNPIKLPSGVDINISGSQLKVKGPKGNLELVLHPGVSLAENDGEYLVKPDGDKHLAMAGTFRALVNPLVVWMWIGGGFMLLGGLVAFWPDRRRLPGSEVDVK